MWGRQILGCDSHFTGKGNEAGRGQVAGPRPPCPGFPVSLWGFCAGPPEAQASTAGGQSPLLWDPPVTHSSTAHAHTQLRNWPRALRPRGPGPPTPRRAWRLMLSLQPTASASRGSGRGPTALGPRSGQPAQWATLSDRRGREGAPGQRESSPVSKLPLQLRIQKALPPCCPGPVPSLASRLGDQLDTLSPSTLPKECLS